MKRPGEPVVPSLLRHLRCHRHNSSHCQLTTYGRCGLRPGDLSVHSTVQCRWHDVLRQKRRRMMTASSRAVVHPNSSEARYFSLDANSTACRKFSPASWRDIARTLQPELRMGERHLRSRRKHKTAQHADAGSSQPPPAVRDIPVPQTRGGSRSLRSMAPAMRLVASNQTRLPRWFRTGPPPAALSLDHRRASQGGPRASRVHDVLVSPTQCALDIGW